MDRINSMPRADALAAFKACCEPPRSRCGTTRAGDTLASTGINMYGGNQSVTLDGLSVWLNIMADSIRLCTLKPQISR